mmetsp:Transcript_754/g.1791  ORF Transcript_754/g.1791 Transcript_754/m.1791 type:complete len:485 (-) Transcript_754:63-1517(-)
MKMNRLFAGFLLFLAVVRPSDASRFGIVEGVPSTQKKSFVSKNLHSTKPSWATVPRGGDADIAPPVVSDDASGPLLMVVSALKGLSSYMQGPKADTMLLLLTTALNTPLSKMIGASPILGYLFLGLLFGPNGFSLVKDIHTTELLADIGIVFFLFEMGIHLDFKTLMSMRRDVFGLGGSQFLVTAAFVAAICKFGFGLSTAAQIVLGGGLALSSSAFVLQLLKDKGEMNTNFGRSSFGVLLLQDLAVVPLLVVTPILAGGGEGLLDALGSAGLKAAIALSMIAFIGKFLLNPFFDSVAKTKNQEAFVGAILATVLGMSFLTEGLGLSNTLGAFLAGILLSETKHRHHIEAEIAPFRGILVGLFFFSVGFEIDLDLIGSKPGLIAAIVLGITTLKAAIASVVGSLFGLKKGTALRLGLILSQGGEFAFVAFRLARSCGIFSDELTKLMLTCVSLTMVLTPFLDDTGAKMAIDLNGESVTKGKKRK